MFEFTELIKAAVIEKHPLIFSANSDICTTSTKWKDFITAIPSCDENIYKAEERGVCYYPIITFGVSISSDAYKPLLYCLDYYRIDRILGALLHLYAQQLSFDFFQFSQSHLEIEPSGETTESAL